MREISSKRSLRLLAFVSSITLCFVSGSFFRSLLNSRFQFPFGTSVSLLGFQLCVFDWLYWTFFQLCGYLILLSSIVKLELKFNFIDSVHCVKYAELHWDLEFVERRH